MSSAESRDGIVTAAGAAGISRAGVAEVTLSEASSRFVVRGSLAAVSSALQTAGLQPATAINTAVRSGESAVLMLGPDEFLVLAPASRREDLVQSFDAAPATAPLAVVDISSRDVGVVLSGPLVEVVLNAACPLPLGRGAFPVDRATRTLFGKATITLWRLAEGRFHLETGRSFAPYVLGLLAEAIRSEQALQR